MSERHNAFAGQGAVLLDIGGDVGAVVVRMPAGLVGTEVEIRRSHGHAHAHVHAHGQHDPHVAVVSRPVPDGGGLVPSLVYDGIEAGDYALGLKGDPATRLVVHVHGGAVTEADWPDSDH